MLTFDASKTERTYAPGEEPEERKFEHIPKDTVLNVEIVRCEVKEVDKKVTPWKKWDNDVSFAFKVNDGGIYNNRWVFGDVEANLDNTTKCTLRQWIEEIIGLKIEDGFEFIPSDFVGLDCRVRVGTYFSKKHQEIKNTVEDVLGVAIEPAESTAVTFNG